MSSVGMVTVDVIPDARDFQTKLENQLPLASMDKMGRRMARTVVGGYDSDLGDGLKHSATKALTSSLQRASKPVQRQAAVLGRTSANTVTRSLGTGLKQSFFPNLNPIMQRSMTRSIQGAVDSATSDSSTWKGFGTGSLMAQTMARNIRAQVDNMKRQQAEADAVRARRSQTLANMASMSTIMLPQLGTGPLSGILGLSATTPKMAAAAGAVAAVGAGLFVVAQGAQAAAAGMQAYGQLAQFALNEAGQLEQTQFALTTMLGDAGKASEFLGKSLKFAQETPFDLNQVASASRQIMAYGFSAKETLPLLRDLGDASTALGLGTDGIQRLVMAFGQIKARGTFRADEARQLTEAGVPAWKALAKAMSEAEGKTITQAEVMKRAEAGAIKAGFALRVLRDQIRSTFGGSMARQALTFAGTVANLQDALKSRMSMAMLPALSGLSRTLRELKPTLSGFSVDIGANLGAGLEGFAKNAVPALKQAIDEIGGAFTPLLSKLGPRFGAIIEDLGASLGSLAPVLADVTDGFYNTAKAATGSMQVMSKFWGKVLGPAGEAVSELGALHRMISDGMLRATGEGEQVDRQNLSEAQAQVTAMGRTLATAMESFDFPKWFPELDVEGMKRGNSASVGKAIAWLEQHPEEARLIQQDPEALKNSLYEAVRFVDQSQLTGEVTIPVEVEMKAAKLEGQLTNLASRVAGAGKAMKFGIDLSGLSNISTALPELQKLQGLTRKDLALALNIDTSKVPAARAKIEELIRYAQYADISMGVDVQTERVTSEMTRLQSYFQQWTGNQKAVEVLVGAKIDPQALMRFSPGAVSQLLGLNKKQYIQLGIQPGQIATFRANLRALLAAGAGSRFNIPVVPTLKPGTGKGILSGSGQAGIGAKFGGKVTIPSQIAPPKKPKLPKITMPKIKAPEVDTSSLDAAAEKGAESGTKLGSNFAQGLEGTTGESQSAGQAIANAGVEGSSTASGGMGAAGANAGASFASGVALAAAQAYAAGAAIAAAALAGAKATLGINSPSREMMKVGDGTVEGFQMGVSRGVKKYMGKGKDKGGEEVADKELSKWIKSTEKIFNRAEKASDKFQKSARKITANLRGIPKMTQEGLDNASWALTRQAHKVEDSSWVLEKAQRKLDKKLSLLDRQQERLDRDIDNNKGKAKGKPNKQQKAEQDRIDRRRKVLNKEQKNLDNEGWQNRKLQRNAEMRQRAIDKRQRVLDRQRALDEGRWELRDIAEDSAGTGSESILASIKDIERRIDRNQIPAKLRKLAEQTRDALRVMYQQEKLKEAFEPVQSALDYKSLRDISPDGVKQWAQGLRDAINDSGLSVGVKSSLGKQLTARIAEVTRYANQLDRIEKGKQLKQQLMDAVGSSIDWNRTANPASLSRSLRKQTASMTQYANDLTRLRQAGLSDKAIQRIAAMDPTQAAKFTQRLVSGGTGAINEFNSAIAGFEKSVEAVGDQGAAAAWAENGQQAALGFKAGMESQEGKIRESLAKIARSMLAEWKKQLGIKSPSQVFADAAREIPRGMVKGMESEQHKVRRAMRRLVSVPTMPQVRTPGVLGEVVVAPGSGAPISIDVHPRQHMNELETARLVARELAWVS